MRYAGMDEFRDLFPFMTGVSGMRHLHLYIIGAPDARMAALPDVRQTLIATVEEAMRDGSVSGICVDLIPDAAGLEHFAHPVWRAKQVMEEHNCLYVPFFLHADLHTDLGQQLFDREAPGVLCVTHDGYLSTTNPSKRGCFDTLWLD